MNKIISLLMIFCIFSCKKSPPLKNEPLPIINFEALYYQNIYGHCNANITSYIDKSNNNLCYIATNCYGISIFCMNNISK